MSPDPDESGVRRLYLELPKSNKLTLEDDKVVLEMGRTAVTVENDGKVEVKTNDQDVTISDSGGNNMLKLEISPGEATLKGQTKVVVDAPQIELVSGSTHPLVFGDDLLKYLNRIVSTFATHTHPGEMALGSFPVTPMTPVPAAAAGDARPAVAEGEDRMRRTSDAPADPRRAHGADRDRVRGRLAAVEGGAPSRGRRGRPPSPVRRGRRRGARLPEGERGLGDRRLRVREAGGDERTLTVTDATLDIGT